MRKGGGGGAKDRAEIPRNKWSDSVHNVHTIPIIFE